MLHLKPYYDVSRDALSVLSGQAASCSIALVPLSQFAFVSLFPHFFFLMSFKMFASVGLAEAPLPRKGTKRKKKKNQQKTPRLFCLWK